MYILLQQSKIPDDFKDNVIAHVVKVHESVGVYSKMFLQKLRRVNYVTPKNYLDFIKTYVKLLEEKDKFVLEQVGNFVNQRSTLQLKFGCPNESPAFFSCYNSI